MLWSDSPPTQARKNLRQTLWQLQCLLEPHGAPDGARLISGNADWVMLKSHSHLWLDVALFEQALSRASSIHGADFDDELAEQVRQAVAIYGGDLLESYYQDWCLYERERLQNGYLALLEKLMSYAESRRDYAAAIEYGERILRCDQAREQTHRQLMRLHFSVGDRVSALRQYQRCVNVLREELGIGPARPTVELYRQIQADSADNMHAPAEHSSLVDALGRRRCAAGGRA